MATLNSFTDVSIINFLESESNSIPTFEKSFFISGNSLPLGKAINIFYSDILSILAPNNFNFSSILS